MNGSVPCTNGSDICSVLNVPCTAATPCGSAKIKGEWFSNPMGTGYQGTGRKPSDRGRLEILPKGPGEGGNRICFRLPWKRIVESANLVSIDPLLPFPIAAAADSANVKWQITTWKNDNTTGDDFMNVDNPLVPCLGVTDVIPNVGVNAVKATDGMPCHFYQDKFDCCLGLMAQETETTDCRADLDGDGIVYPGDAMIFLADYGREDCPCKVQ